MITAISEYVYLFIFFKWTSYLIRFFARSSEYYFVRVNSICESKHRVEVALELRDSFDSSQNLWVHSFLINLALFCDFVFLSLCWRSHPPDVSPYAASSWSYVSVRCSRIFTPLKSILVEVAMTNFWCVLRRGTRLRDRGPGGGGGSI